MALEDIHDYLRNRGSRAVPWRK